MLTRGKNDCAGADRKAWYHYSLWVRNLLAHLPGPDNRVPLPERLAALEQLQNLLGVALHSSDPIFILVVGLTPVQFVFHNARRTIQFGLALRPARGAGARFLKRSPQASSRPRAPC